MYWPGMDSYEGGYKGVTATIFVELWIKWDESAMDFMRESGQAAVDLENKYVHDPNKPKAANYSQLEQRIVEGIKSYWQGKSN